MDDRKKYLKHDWTSEEIRANASKGGKALAAKRRKDKAFAQMVQSLSTMTAVDEVQKRCLDEFGISDVTNIFACAAALFRRAMEGDNKATELLLKIRGEMPSDRVEVTGRDGKSLSPEPLRILVVDNASANETAGEAEPESPEAPEA